MTGPLDDLGDTQTRPFDDLGGGPLDDLGDAPSASPRPLTLAPEDEYSHSTSTFGQIGHTLGKGATFLGQGLVHGAQNILDANDKLWMAQENAMSGPNAPRAQPSPFRLPGADEAPLVSTSPDFSDQLITGTAEAAGENAPALVPIGGGIGIAGKVGEAVAPTLAKSLGGRILTSAIGSGVGGALASPEGSTGAGFFRNSVIGGALPGGQRLAASAADALAERGLVSEAFKPAAEKVGSSLFAGAGAAGATALTGGSAEDVRNAALQGAALGPMGAEERPAYEAPPFEPNFNPALTERPPVDVGQAFPRVTEAGDLMRQYNDAVRTGNIPETDRLTALISDRYPQTNPQTAQLAGEAQQVQGQQVAQRGFDMRRAAEAEQSVRPAGGTVLPGGTPNVAGENLNPLFELPSTDLAAQEADRVAAQQKATGAESRAFQQPNQQRRRGEVEAGAYGQDQQRIRDMETLRVYGVRNADEARAALGRPDMHPEDAAALVREARYAGMLPEGGTTDPGAVARRVREINTQRLRGGPQTDNYGAPRTAYGDEQQRSAVQFAKPQPGAPDSVYSYTPIDRGGLGEGFVPPQSRPEWAASDVGPNAATVEKTTLPELLAASPPKVIGTVDGKPYTVVRDEPGFFEVHADDGAGGFRAKGADAEDLRGQFKPSEPAPSASQERPLATPTPAASSQPVPPPIGPATSQSKPNAPIPTGAEPTDYYNPRRNDLPTPEALDHFEQNLLQGAANSSLIPKGTRKLADVTGEAYQLAADPKFYEDTISKGYDPNRKYTDAEAQAARILAVQKSTEAADHIQAASKPGLSPAESEAARLMADEADSVAAQAMSIGAPERTLSGRNLGAYKVIASTDADPVVVQARMERLAGRPLTDAEAREVRATTGEISRSMKAKDQRSEMAARAQLRTQAEKLSRDPWGVTVGKFFRATNLLGTGTIARNFLSNSVNAVRLAAERPVAALTDAVLRLGNNAVADSKGTPLLGADRNRTVLAGWELRSGRTAAQRMQQSLVQSAKDIGTYLKTGVEPADFTAMAKRFDEIHGSNSGVNWLDGWINGVNRFQGSQDLPFRKYALMRALDEQGTLRAMADKEAGTLGSRSVEDAATDYAAHPDTEMQLKAIEQAEFATYMGKNGYLGKLAQTINSARERLGKADNPLANALGLGIDFALPYRQVPLNVIEQSLRLLTAPLETGLKAPKALAKAAKGELTAADRETFARLAGRGSVGVAAFVLGYALAEKGVVYGFRQNKKDLADLDTARGQQAGSLNVAGKNRAVKDSMGPLGSLFFLGATAQREMNRFRGAQEGDAASIGKDVAGYTTQIATDSPSMQFASNLQKVAQGQMTGAQMFGTATNFLIPSPVDQAAKALDSGIPRDARQPMGADLMSNVGASAKYQIPMMRSQLPRRMDATGVEAPAVNAFDPTTARPLRNSPGLDMMARLGVGLGDERPAQGETRPDFEQRMKMRGGIIMQAADRLAADPVFQTQPRGVQVEVLNRILSHATDAGTESSTSARIAKAKGRVAALNAR